MGWSDIRREVDFEMEAGGGKAGGLQQFQFAGARHGLQAIVHAELVVEVVDVGLDRAVGNHQSIGDLLIGESCGDHAQHFQFALTQRLS